MTVARWLETDSLTNQNIASALAIGAYTADADRMIVVDVSLDQVAGNGDYVIYVTRQINGAGSAYVMLPKTTCAAASGETAIAMQSGMISVRSGDVLTVYVDGLAGDTTTPDTVVRWFEIAMAGAQMDLVDAPNATAVAAIQSGLATPTNITAASGISLAATQGAVAFGQVRITANVAGQGALDIRNSNAGGYGQLNTGQTGMYNGGVSVGVSNYGGDYGQLNEGNVLAVAGVDAPGVRTAIGLATANLDTQLAALPTDQDVRDAMKLAPTAGAPAAGSVDAKLDDILLDTGTTLPGLLSGAGSTAYSNTVTDSSSNPLDGVEVWITSDSGGASTVASTTTDTLGAFTVYLDPGTYYLWLALGGYNFPNPTTITVS